MEIDIVYHETIGNFISIIGLEMMPITYCIISKPIMEI